MASSEKINTSSTTQWNCAPHKQHQTTQQYKTADPLLHCTTNTIAAILHFREEELHRNLNKTQNCKSSSVLEIFRRDAPICT